MRWKVRRAQRNQNSVQSVDEEEAGMWRWFQILNFIGFLSLKMKFFNWMQIKLNGRQCNRKLNTHKQDSKEEFSDWSQGLLAIGTFGNTHLTEKQETQIVPNPELKEFTPEEFGKLQNELTELLSKKQAKEQISDLPLDRFLNCPSSLDVDRTISNRYSTNSDDKDEEIERTIRIILGRCKDVCENKKKITIGRKSVSFLLKKMFVCTGGLVPNPSLRDTFHESRMEKVQQLLRTILTNKIYPQNSSRASSMKKYIDDRNSLNAETEDEMRKKGRDGHKWVKTDSEYIVLEI
ncbi:unnamed protein product [Fraxinus pennsylvanica]|uniref:Uncharacterized protein n=1 Tax=Fraxinus pennsylvanica TaxID=56036 RepID=A0AAD2E3F3_9LAMI|nr:unnamed protein product [Fraxinus pennsylvanica]